MSVKLWNIPVIGIGPGSQPIEEDGSELDYMSMPQGMSYFQPAALPEQEDLQAYPKVLELLGQLQTQLDTYIIAPQTPCFLALEEVQAVEKKLLAQMLSEGEVSILFDEGNGNYREIQETSLPGLWWHRFLDRDKQITHEMLEIGFIPYLIQQDTFSQASNVLNPSMTENQGLINAPWLLAELQEHIAKNTQGHVLNLTLLPLTEDDLAFLVQTLGTGKTAILSRGYGNCRITATAIKPVWWVQYYNSTDTLILNTLEVVDVPLVACAALEDLTDSATRLREMREALA